MADGPQPGAVLANPQSSGGNMFNWMALALSGPREDQSYDSCQIGSLQSPEPGTNRGEPRGFLNVQQN